MYRYLHLRCGVVYVIAGSVLFITQNSTRRYNDWTAPVYIIVYTITEGGIRVHGNIFAFTISVVGNKPETLHYVSCRLEIYYFIMLVTVRSRYITDNFGLVRLLLRLQLGPRPNTSKLSKSVLSAMDHQTCIRFSTCH